MNLSTAAPVSSVTTHVSTDTFANAERPPHQHGERMPLSHAASPLPWHGPRIGCGPGVPGPHRDRFQRGTEEADAVESLAPAAPASEWRAAIAQEAGLMTALCDVHRLRSGNGVAPEVG